MAFKKMTVTMTTFFLTFCSQNGCYKSSLTHLKFTKSHLQRSRFKKVFPRGKPPDPCFWGGRFAAGEGWGGRGKGRDGREGEWKGEGMWRGPESGLPGARAGSRAGLASRQTCVTKCVIVVRPPRPVIIGWRINNTTVTTTTSLW